MSAWFPIRVASTGLAPVKLPRRAPGRQRDHYDFLPPTLQILETPPSPIRMALIFTLCGLASTALAWGYWGRIDTVATAQGKIQPIGRVKVVQPLESGTVSEINASNGMHVERGDLLIAMDSADANADLHAAQLGLASVRAEIARRTTAGVAVSTASFPEVPVIAWDDAVPRELRQREDRILAAEFRMLGSSLEAIEAQKLQKQQEADQLVKTMAAQEQLISTLQQRVDMRSELVRVDAGTRSALFDATESLQYQLMQRALQMSQLVSAQTAQTILAKQIAKTLDDFVAHNAQKLGAAERQAEAYSQALAKAEAKLAHMRLKAPISGVVQASTIVNAGQVVGSGQEVMRIVPDGTVLEVQVYVRNRDIGSIKVGQTAIIKVEAFPFTRYGTINAQVAQIASDAIPEPDASVSEGDPARATSTIGLAGAQRTQNLVFPVTLTLDATSIAVEGHTVPLISGMAVTADLQTGRRRILDYLLSPVLEVAATTMRER